MLVIDQDKCIGCELCCEICPEVFKMSDIGSIDVIVQTVEPERDADIEEAIVSCPVEAIEIK